MVNSSLRARKTGQPESGMLTVGRLCVRARPVAVPLEAGSWVIMGGLEASRKKEYRRQVARKTCFCGFLLIFDRLFVVIKPLLYFLVRSLQNSISATLLLAHAGEIALGLHDDACLFLVLYSFLEIVYPFYGMYVCISVM